MDLDETAMAGVVGALTIIVITLFALAVGSTEKTRDIRVCETTISDTGTVERCWDEKEIVN